MVSVVAAFQAVACRQLLGLEPLAALVFVGIVVDAWLASVVQSVGSAVLAVGLVACQVGLDSQQNLGWR